MHLSSRAATQLQLWQVKVLHSRRASSSLAIAQPDFLHESSPAEPSALCLDLTTCVVYRMVFYSQLFATRLTVQIMALELS